MKRCNICNEQKNVDEFYNDRTRPDGKQYRCKQCMNKLSAKWNTEHPDELRAIYRTHAKSEKGKASIQAYVLRHRDRFRSRGILKTAVARNKITKPTTCARCGRESHQIEAHHEDYSKPLDVLWLCRKCHLQLHRDKSRSQLAHPPLPPW